MYKTIIPGALVSFGSKLLLNLKMIFSSKYSPSFLKFNSCQICIYGDCFLTLLDPLLHRVYASLFLPPPPALHSHPLELGTHSLDHNKKPQKQQKLSKATEPQEPEGAAQQYWHELGICTTTQRIDCPQYTTRTWNAAQNTSTLEAEGQKLSLCISLENKSENRWIRNLKSFS